MNKRLPVVLALSALAIAIIAFLAISSSRSEDGDLADGDADPVEIEAQPSVPMAPAAVDTKAEGVDSGSDYPVAGPDGPGEAQTLDDLASPQEGTGPADGPRADPSGAPGSN